MKIVLITVIVGLFLGGCSYLNKKVGLEDDNFVEESAEALIEHHTGIDIDLSPQSSE